MLAPDEVEIEVRAAGLNFRDVLDALGLYPGEQVRLAEMVPELLPESESLLQTSM